MILPIVVDLWWMACMYSTILFRHWESHVCLDFLLRYLQEIIVTIMEVFKRMNFFHIN